MLICYYYWSSDGPPLKSGKQKIDVRGQVEITLHVDNVDGGWFHRHSFIDYNGMIVEKEEHISNQTNKIGPSWVITSML